MVETNEDIIINVFTFSDWEPDSIQNIVAELNEIGGSMSPKVSFSLRADRPNLPSMDQSEWLEYGQIVRVLSQFRVKGDLSIVLTKHRLNLDFFGDTFPRDGIAVITTYNNFALPRDILEKQYILYSFTYCVIDLVIDPNLWHAETRACIFDQVLVLPQIADGLMSCAICEICHKALSRFVKPRERAVITFVERLLANLSNKIVDRPTPTKVSRARRRRTTPLTNLGSAKNGFLIVDRNAMRRALDARFGIDTDETFADHPERIRAVLDQVTTKVAERADSITRKLENLVRLNHTTDIFYLDIDKRHRDHSLHQLYVALFGFEVLDTRIPHIRKDPKFQLEYTPFRHFLTSKLNMPHERADWVWYITAILHDHAYPLSALLSRIARYLRVSRNVSAYELMGMRLKGDVDFYKALMAPQLAALVDDALLSAAENRSNADEFEEEYVNMLRRALSTSLSVHDIERRMPESRYDHGVIGAANLALLINGDRSTYIEEICHAIFEHNLKDELILEAQPLSFLLKLCDTLQEWDRIVYPSGGSPIRESERIEIGPFHKTQNGLQIEKPLKVRFFFTRKEVLDRSGWDPERFREGTRQHLQLLKNNDQAFMQLDEMEIDYVQSL